jgi:hypothetical protein
MQAQTDKETESSTGFLSKLLLSPWVHPFLFAIFPVLFLYSQNIAETQVGDIFRALILVCIITVVSLLVFSLIFRSNRKAAIMTSLSLVLFFSFGRISGLLGMDPNHWVNLEVIEVSPTKLVTIGSAVILVLVMILLILTHRKLERLTKSLNGVTLILILVQVGTIAYGEIVYSGNASTYEDQQVSLTMPDDPPDVYFIVVDAYGRHDVLKDMYSFDNSGFLNHLQDLGFRIGRYSNSNYCQTMLSLPATLNLNYLQNLAKLIPESSNRKILSTLFQRCFFLNELQKIGYEVVTFKTGYAATNFERADQCFANGLELNEFENNLLNSTPVPILMKKVLPQYEMHRRRVEEILNTLPELHRKEKPLLVFAHIAAPHPPFVFGPNGEHVDPDRAFTFSDGNHFVEFGGTIKEYLRGYHDQITYLTSRLQKTVDRILSHYPEKKPLIIIQGDHGPGSELHWQNAGKTNQRERMGILNACLLPNLDSTAFYDEITPINTFRLIADAYFEGRFPRLQDRSYFSPWTKPYLFFDVTPEVYIPERP